MTSRRPADTTFVARLTADPATARRVMDLIAESFEPSEIATAAFERAPGSWIVETYFLRQPDETVLRELVALAGGGATADTLRVTALDTKDWVQASLDQLPPVFAGRFAVHGRHARARVPGNRTRIEIEATLAFGTGHHGSTRGCLIALDAWVKQRKQAPRPTSSPPANGRVRRILDIGTGTGVLAIAAAKATRCGVLASDIDARAAAIARDNAELNGVAGVVEVMHAAGVAGRRFRAGAPYRLILANILLEPLQRLAAPIARLADRRTRVVLSGLLARQENAALAAYRAQGLALERRLLIDGWVTLVLRRQRRRSPLSPLSPP
jgi:ribosomal protein L11 methyltransferase